MANLLTGFQAFNSGGILPILNSYFPFLGHSVPLHTFMNTNVFSKGYREREKQWEHIIYVQG